MTVSSIADQLDAVDRALASSEAWAEPEAWAAAGRALDRGRSRLGLGLDHTIVALGGPTGAGKSTLFNALVGADVSPTGVRRPTTGESHAAVWSDTADPVLDWLGIRRRHHGEPDARRRDLVLVDLPDHDSTVDAHRAEVDRLVELVDLFVWVVDPQKYADHSLHDGYLRRLAHHGDVMVFVLSKTDLVSDGDAEACRDDLHRRLVADGIPEPRIVSLSVPRDGAAPIEDVVLDAVGRRRAAVERVRSDLIRAIGPVVPAADSTSSLSRRARSAFVDSVGSAAGYDEAGRVAGAHDRHRAVAAVGWPVTAPLRRFRRPPATGWSPPTASPVAGSEIEQGLRRLADDAADGADQGWRRALRDDLAGRAPAVLSRLDEVVGSATVAARPRRWWAVVRLVQRVLAVIALVGAVWVIGTLVADALLNIDTDAITPDTPGAEWLPLPTAVLLGGLTAGFLTGFLAGLAASVGARRVTRRTRSRLRQEAERVADSEVLDPLSDLLDERRRVRELLVETGLVESR